MAWGLSQIGGAVALAFYASPALAQASSKVPEPTDFALFGLAVAGLIIGRQSSKHPPANPAAEKPEQQPDA